MVFQEMWPRNWLLILLGISPVVFITKVEEKVL